MCVVRTLNIYFLSRFQVYNTLLLTILTMLYIRSPELSHLLTESLYPLTNISPVPQPSTLGNHHSTLCFFSLSSDFFRFHIKVRSCSICLSVSGLFHLAKCPPRSSILLQMAGLKAIVHINHIFLYPFIH